MNVVHIDIFLLFTEFLIDTKGHDIKVNRFILKTISLCFVTLRKILSFNTIDLMLKKMCVTVFCLVFPILRFSEFTLF